MGRSRRPSPAPESFDQLLRPNPSSVAAARALVRDLLTAADRDDLREDAVLLVSEVVTNAVIHAGSPIRVRGHVGADGIRVEVSDASPHHPALRDYADMAGTGRGLALLIELVDDWGVATADIGKTVWFELGSETRRDPVEGKGATQAVARAVVPARQRSGSAATVRVQLLMVPLLLHEAWREHAETLLREYLLASLDHAPGRTGLAAAEGGETVDPIQVHADATDAIALLEEQLPVARIDMEPARLMAGATEPIVTAPEVWLEVPESSVSHFATLARALEQAFVLVDSGRVLAPKTQPEIQAFRHWVCHQVEGQALGEPAVAWSIDRETRDPRALRHTGDAFDDITSSSDSLIAADDANQIVAVSPSAVELLGYASTDELVGRRLVAIIPPRFHQAHIAGFTLHLLVGRSPLLGREVVVPAVRRDGSEVLARLLVTTRRAPDGSAVFVARLRDAQATTPGS